MKATGPSGSLSKIDNCYIILGDGNALEMRVLPDISDSKSATYSDEPVIGRSFPVKTFSHGDNRVISWSAHFVTCKQGDAETNLQSLRSIEGSVYPRTKGGATPYQPPPICKLKCGFLLANDELCAILKSYSVKFPTEWGWDLDTYVPFKFDVDMSFEVVYDSTSLPGAEKIFEAGG